eukprot:TRINITY_DN1359_c0_g1_i1.p1 TRINITY_DN1359_c0_g1~~TRINITY_DN1359_c0_g1_i1.p1  ORF type:complete len:254 (+),score=40.83 TRINITY_DN1359_c0_g1_i1:113-763(+)
MIRAKEEHFEETEKRIAEALERVDTQIDLNVGGTRVSTSKETLLSVEGTYFYAMLASDKWKPNGKGEYFIDRNPKYFFRIIDYLKTGKLRMEDLNISEREEFDRELDYYQIPQLHWNPEQKGDNIELSNNNKTALKTGPSGHCSVIGDQPVPSFQVKIDTKVSNWAMIGLVPKTANLNDSNYVCGWHLFVGRGTLYAQSGEGDRPVSYTHLTLPTT